MLNYPIFFNELRLVQFNSEIDAPIRFKQCLDRNNVRNTKKRYILLNLVAQIMFVKVKYEYFEIVYGYKRFSPAFDLTSVQKELR